LWRIAKIWPINSGWSPHSCRAVTLAAMDDTFIAKGRQSIEVAGDLIGHDSGPVDLQVWVTDSSVGRDTPQGSGGLNVWLRIGFKI
jgi:hypothetical protein